MSHEKRQSFGQMRAALLAATILMGTPAWAQAGGEAAPGTTAPASGAAAMGEGGAPMNDAARAQDIVVTAQFRSQRLQDTPLAITALNAQLLQARNLTNIQQIGEQAPNVVIKPAGSVYGPAAQIFIRGIGQGDTSFALEPGVGVYIDDVYFSTVFGSVFDLVDLDRVEILRGPQGTLAGKNSIGGAVKLFSRQPGNDFGGSVEGSVGSFSEKSLRATLNVPIVKDKLAFRLAGVAHYTDGYVKSYDYGCLHPGSGVPSFQQASGCRIGSEGGQKYYGLRGILRWTPSSDVTVSLTGDYSTDRSEPAATVLTLAQNRGRYFLNGTPFDAKFVTGGKYINYATYNDPGGIYTANTPTGPVVITRQASGFALPRDNRLNDGGVSGTIKWDIADDVSLTSITAYRQYHGRFSSDADESPFNFQLVSNDFKHRQFTEEVRLSGASFGRALEWTVGGFYLKARDITGGRVFFPTNFDTLLNDPSRPRSASAFVHGTYHITHRLDLTAGLRYSDERKSYVYHREDPSTGLPPPGLAAIDGVGTVYKGHRADYKVDVDYHFTDTIMAYAQWSTGFRSGGVNSRVFASNQVVPFKPETLQAYEIGAKSTFLDRAVTLNVAGFINKYDHILLGTTNRYVNPNLPINEDPTSPTYNPAAGTFPSTVIINGGRADIKGFEVETRVQPVHGLDIDGSVSYLDFQFKSISAAALSTGITLDSGRPYTPKWKWNVGAQYEIGLGGLGSLTPRIDALYQGTIFTGAVKNPYNTVNHYTIANAQLTWRSNDRNTEAVLSVSNLFDKYYYLNKFETVAISGIALGQPGLPRAWRLTLRRRF